MFRPLASSSHALRAALAGAALLIAPAVHAQAPQKPAAPQKATPAKPAPPAPATPAANNQAPAFAPSHMALAREVMLSSGIARSFDSIIPAFSEQIRQNAVTRPELGKDLDEVLVGLQPEMELQKQAMIDTAARIYATRLTEAELSDIATFFRSPAGKRYVETQPQVLDGIVQAMQGWTQEVSEYVMVRVRAEMVKRGHQLQ
ncbi:hypothetical protein ASG60_03130 [Methylobacterium sp. Leaf469]|jgi:hypothetical protein|uniref:DUF2059 domain-containing protein n=1 Tax=unclassified Methylobacterium TaxID=2615210 RepID=UPI0006F2513E|nr:MULTISPECIES: DUF2059 domain-containing protein [unclassified Methylobacterium]KQO65961.1 hypothetical protein ASF22_04625 [Methylobacterium sp. Leaf87]KQP18858.1 hypothetical protein ASF25_10550 [Methylobacterium sp. Leaf100]KQP34587.1 hypothetical protein ASF27_03355 [Methylobacterium sp. Leaf102]KQU05661.1 hypothetical protein ASG60_03130 [Methylobacterium sp. Leaf469]